MKQTERDLGERELERDLTRLLAIIASYLFKFVKPKKLTTSLIVIIFSPFLYIRDRLCH